MPQYLLPCTCGKKTAVSTAQAGEMIRCACGAELQVPTMRALGALEPAGAEGGTSQRRAHVWEDRHRGAFLLVLGSLACLGVAAYLWFAVPPLARSPNAQDVQNIAKSIENASPAEAFQVYSEMGAGLAEPAVDPNEKPRRMMFWGSGLAFALAAAFLAGAGLVLLGRSRRRSGN